MKKMSEVIRFIMLSGYAEADQMEKMVQRHHEKWTERYSKWSYESTKQKLLSAYWTTIVPLHFICIFSSALILSLLIPIRTEDLPSITVVVFCVVFVAVIVLRLTLYKPVYLNDYLPLLNHTTEKLSGAYLKELDTVKKGQYSSVAIVLIHAVTNKLAGFPKPTGSKITKDQLVKLCGISERSLHDAMNIVFKANWKTSPRMDTEIADAFGEAREYFSATGNSEAAKLLDDIKLDVLVKRQPPSY